MRLGKYAIPATLACAALFASCSSGSDPVALNSIATAVQDLTVDPSGSTTVLTFTSDMGLSGATVANFEAEDGETPVVVSVAGAMVTVEWSARVAPSNRVRSLGIDGVAATFANVTTSDASSPTFTITDGTQNPGLGGDIVEVTFAGPWVVESDAEDLDNWTLTIDATAMDLTGSTFVLDEPTQVLTITLGTLANLHASFDLAASGVRGVNDANVATTAVAGVATGDAVAPTLVSVEQNLTEDEFGRVVDFTFSEAMDPVFAAQLSHFSVASPYVATSIEQPAEDLLRLSFSGPIVPGQQDVTLTGLVDAHGNAFADAVVPVTQPSPVANAFDGTPAATTVENEGGDVLTVVTTQALDPITAADPLSWDLVVDGNTIDLSLQTLTYDLLAKTLTVDLDFDMTNGDAFQVTGLTVLDVDGEPFTDVANGNVSGDATAPTVLSITQNRNVDPTGKSLDVQFSEDVVEAAAETFGNYVDSGAMSLTSATLLTGLDSVRLVYDDVVVPGDVMFSIAGLADLAGNALTPVVNMNAGSTDTTSPSVAASDVQAIAGADNDTLAVRFDDDLIAAEVEDPASWTVESPLGTPVSLTGVTVLYTAATRLARMTFENGVDFQRGDDFQVALANFRDIGGNVVSTTPTTGDVVSETIVPLVHTVYRESSLANELVVRFTEPCTHLDDLYDVTTNADGTRYIVRDSLGALRGYAATATVLDEGLGVRLGYGFTIAASDTLDVLGCADLAGNPLLPALAVATVAEDTTQPSLVPGFNTLTCLSGENNDEIAIVFDRPMSPWNLFDDDRYSVTGPNGLVDLAFATFTFDGLSTVTIRLRAATNNNLVFGSSYDVSANDVWSAQGTERTIADNDVGLFVVGDSISPSVAVNDVRLDPADANSLLITVDETVKISAAANAANYDLNAGTLASSASRIAPHVIRATFGVPLVAGDVLEFNLTDLADNFSGTITRTVTSADATAPLVAGVVGTIVPGYGGDTIDVSFDEPVTSSVLPITNWTVLSNGTPLNLTGTRFTLVGAGNTVRLILPDTADLDANGNVSVTITTASDFAGNAFAAPVTLPGTVSGDSIAPSALPAFVNWRADPTGTTVDVWFDEEVDSAMAGAPLSWTATGGVTVQTVETLELDHYRLTLSGTLAAAGTLSITGLQDPARNAAGVLTIDPQE